jgi:hypothetical protein
LWLIKVWFSASTFVVKIATFAKRQNVSHNAEIDKRYIKNSLPSKYIPDKEFIN